MINNKFLVGRTCQITQNYKVESVIKNLHPFSVLKRVNPLPSLQSTLFTNVIRSLKGKTKTSGKVTKKAREKKPNLNKTQKNSSETIP